MLLYRCFADMGIPAPTVDQMEWWQAHAMLGAGTTTDAPEQQETPEERRLRINIELQQRNVRMRNDGTIEGELPAGVRDEGGALAKGLMRR